MENGFVNIVEEGGGGGYQDKWCSLRGDVRGTPPLSIVSSILFTFINHSLCTLLLYYLTFFYYFHILDSFYILLCSLG